MLSERTEKWPEMTDGCHTRCGPGKFNNTYLATVLPLKWERKQSTFKWAL